MEDNIIKYDYRLFDEKGIHKRTNTRFNERGYDKYGYDKYGFKETSGLKHINKYTNDTYDIDGYDYRGFNINGYDREGYDKHHFDKNGINKYTNDIYDIDGFEKKAYVEFSSFKNKNGFSKIRLKNGSLYDEDGYDYRGFNRNGIHKITGTEYDEYGYDVEKFNQSGWDIEGINKKTHTHYDQDGFNIEGYNTRGFNREGIHIETDSIYDTNGYKINGFNQDGIHRITHTKYDKSGYDEQGFNEQGFNKEGIHKITGTIYNPDGYDSKGYNEQGYDINGINKNGKTEEQVIEDKNIKISIYNGLINKAERLAKGELSVDDYLKKSKLTIDELIVFAKTQKLDNMVIANLSRLKAEFKKKQEPFNKDKLLNLSYLVNGEEVQVTEKDIDKCVEYMKENDMYICQYNVKNLIRDYKKGINNLDSSNEQSQTIEQKPRIEKARKASLEDMLKLVEKHNSANEQGNSHRK